MTWIFTRFNYGPLLRSYPSYHKSFQVAWISSDERLNCSTCSESRSEQPFSPSCLRRQPSSQWDNRRRPCEFCRTIGCPAGSAST